MTIVKCKSCKCNIAWEDAHFLKEASFGDFDDDPKYNKFLCDECRHDACNDCGENPVSGLVTNMYGNPSCDSCKEKAERKYDNYVTRGY